MASDFTLREATSADIERIRSHVHNAYRGDSARKGWTAESDLLDGQRTDPQELEALVSSQDAQLWLLEQGEQLLGSMVIKRESNDVAHLGMIAVRPDQQAHGVGRALLQKAEQVVIEQGWGQRLEMTVIGQRTELIAWYERRGYQLTEERRPFPYDDPRFGLPKRPDLYFRVLTKELSKHS